VRSRAPSRADQAEAAPRYSSSIKPNWSWRRGSDVGGKSFGFSRLERDFGLGFFGPTSPPIGQPLANDPLRGLRHALIVVDAERDALVVAEIELAEIAMQMALGNVVVHADDAA